MRDGQQNDRWTIAHGPLGCKVAVPPGIIVQVSPDSVGHPRLYLCLPKPVALAGRYLPDRRTEVCNYEPYRAGPQQVADVVGDQVANLRSHHRAGVVPQLDQRHSGYKADALPLSYGREARSDICRRLSSPPSFPMVCHRRSSPTDAGNR